MRFPEKLADSENIKFIPRTAQAKQDNLTDALRQQLEKFTDVMKPTEKQKYLNTLKAQCEIQLRAVGQMLTEPKQEVKRPPFEDWTLARGGIEGVNAVLRPYHDE